MPRSVAAETAGKPAEVAGTASPEATARASVPSIEALPLTTMRSAAPGPVARISIRPSALWVNVPPIEIAAAPRGAVGRTVADDTTSASMVPVPESTPPLKVAIPAGSRMPPAKRVSPPVCR